MAASAAMQWSVRTSCVGHQSVTYIHSADISATTGQIARGPQQ